MDTKKILVIIPAYNEAGNIKKTIDEILALKSAVDILVVNDGSKDGTAQEAGRTPVAVISLPFNLGVGGAVQTGFQFALQNHYDVAVQVDGDNQHDVSFLPALLSPVLQNGSDIAIGSRFIQPFLGYRSSLIRRVGIHFFAHLISFLTQYSISDPTSGFRAYNRRAIQAFAADYPHDFPEPEAIVTAKRLGLKVVEVPVQMRKRMAGNSSIRYLNTLYYMIKVTFAILLNMIKKRKVMEA
ncbi:MAG: hypothetical protein A3D10_07100 [Omnitrophica WOR_2 bacterium RIFCSPHIGHO2_02_FULL_48_11]|nr:MAG: hypothetical protein A3D10_07100 [Omnitrophica WOR_2 bacterium RIFCSPHIGHO2_02_FULL_48_11]